MTTTHSYIMPTYARQPISFTHGKGSWLYTADKTAYLDALTGIAVCGLGHCHPAITDAITHQASTLVHTSNLYGIDWQEKAAESLCTAANMDNAFFANSGAEANEAALKMARLYGHKQGFKHPKVIVMQRSFHGRTLLTLSATANPKARAGFYTLDQDFIRVPFDDIDAIKQALQQHDEITAILLEPIQGEGGLNTPKDISNYLKQIKSICDQHHLLFMLDEVQTGNGRTGKFFAHHYSEVSPDVLTTAKGLGNGFPVAACMTKGRAKDLLTAGTHGSTFGGTPLASRVVYTVYDILRHTNVMQNALTEGRYIQNCLVDELKQYGIYTRGQGMMIGVVLPENVNDNTIEGKALKANTLNCSLDYSSLVDEARENHNLIINVTGGHVIRLLPPLNLTRTEADQLIERLVNLIKTKISLS